MDDEKESNYEWAFQQFYTYFTEPVKRHPNVFGSGGEEAVKKAAKTVDPETPQYLCYWHIQKNFQTEIDRYLKAKNGRVSGPSTADKELVKGIMKGFDKVNYAPIQIVSKYRDSPVLLRYLDKYQYPQPHSVTKPWTSKLLHYVNTITSKLEGAHQRIKGFLRSSRSDLLMMVTKLSNAHANWLHEYLALLARSYDQPNAIADAKKMSDCCDPMLNRHITNHGMELLGKQYTRAKSLDMKPKCSGHSQSIYSIACWHTIKRFIDEGRMFSADEFDERWYRQRDELESDVDIRGLIAERRARRPLLFEPKKRQRRSKAGLRRTYVSCQHLKLLHQVLRSD
jgi:hypothetical protein